MELLTRKKNQLFILLVLIPVVIHSFEFGELSISLNPGGVIPLGENASSFETGGGVDFSIDIDLDSIKPIFLKSMIGYDYLPIVTSDGISLFSITVGAGLKVNPIEKITLSAFGAGGYYYGSMTDGSGLGGGNLVLTGGLNAHYNITPSISLGINADYTMNSTFSDVLGISLGTTIYPGRFRSNGNIAPSIDLLEALSPGVSGSGLDVETINFNQIFPVLFKHYDTNPVGTVKLFNNESSLVTDVTISFFVDRYMDNPKQSSPIEKIDGKSGVKIDIFALFSDSVLDNTEGTKVSTNVILKYTQKNKTYTRKYVSSMDIYDRNAITWDDDRKAAAFVTAKDPVVLEFAKNVSGWIKQISPSAIDRNLCIAMGIHNSLTEYGISYQVDPKTPFTDYSKDSLSVDFLQFPRQTLTYSSGDCDDLSILYSALLEAVGIETAFITIPGHIYMAFALAMTPDEAKKTYHSSDDLIFLNERVWLPVEITMVQEDFLKAWATGAKEWRENAVRNQAVLYPMHDSWNEYKPVGLTGATEITMPDKDAILSTFKSEISSFIDREIFPQVERIEAQILATNNSPRFINRLGVLYARYGLNDKAESQFQKILAVSEYVPALINMGNLQYMNNNISEAFESYTRASEKEPDNSKVLLSIAKASYKLEDYGLVKESYDRLKILDPELAERFLYLDLRGDETSRAAEVNSLSGVIVWAAE